MKKPTKYSLAASAALALPLFFASCEVEKTQDMKLPDVDVDAEAGELPDVDVVVKEEGKLPSVDVDVEKGQLPKYDVNAPEVDVKVEKETIEVPVPKVEVDIPDEQDKTPGE